MGAKEQALKDIQKYLTPKAIADNKRRKEDSARWYRFSNRFVSEHSNHDNFMLRVAHLTDPSINLTKLSK